MDSRLARVAPPLYAALAAVVVLAHLPALVTVIFAAPLVLFVPGFALVLALDLPGEPEHPGRRLVLAVALSFASTALGGLVLNAVAELTATSWAIWLLAFTSICSIAGLVQDTSTAGLGAELDRSRAWVARHARRAPVLELTAGVLAVLLFVAAALLSEESARSNYNKPLTQLSLLPAAGSDGQAVRVTITNLTGATEQVDLTVFRGDRQVSTMPVTVVSAASWTRQESLTGRILRATLTVPGRVQPFSEVSWTGRAPLAPLAPLEALRANPPAHRASKPVA